MVNWPFAHEYRMTYSLHEGALEVRTEVINRSSEPMPITLGFHPYFNLPDTPRTQAFVRIPARKHIETDKELLRTGVTSPNHLPGRFRSETTTSMMDSPILIRDKNGYATFSL